MAVPRELSLAEIRKYMLANGCTVTNHALVKHFKRFLTHPETQNEARKQFKTYVNILATIKNENNQKFLILRKKYLHECPAEDVVQRALAAATSEPGSPASASIMSNSVLPASPFRTPPPYKPPPMVGGAGAVPKAAAPAAIADVPKLAAPTAAAPSKAPTTGVAVNQANAEQYRDCVNEFADAVRRIDPARLARQQSEEEPSRDAMRPIPDDDAVQKRPSSISRANSAEGDTTNNKENIPRFSFSSGASATSSTDSEKPPTNTDNVGGISENPISVKEATRIFNRMASEEEAKVLIAPGKKKQKALVEEQEQQPEVTMSHPKAKEWIVAMARANYQELSKLATEHPELVKLQDPATMALHWAAKHGNSDVVKLIAGTHKADVNARTNAGYTPLHLAMQFDRVHIFELLCNVYKARRDLMDWSGNKPLDYSKQRTSVSASTYSKIKARRKHAGEKDLGFLRIGSLNVRVKKTTEAFSHFLGVGNGTPVAAAGSSTASLPHPKSHNRHPHHRYHVGTTRSLTKRMAPPSARSSQSGERASANHGGINSKFDMLHKSWGSADNIPHSSDASDMMPPPKITGTVKKRPISSRSSFASNATDSPRDSISSSNSSSNIINTGYSSMPTTPNQLRAPLAIGLGALSLADSDSDSACGFDSNWSVNGRTSISNEHLQNPRFA